MPVAGFVSGSTLKAAARFLTSVREGSCWRPGVSNQALIYAELDCKRAGDAISFDGRELVIKEVA
jgi:hypothetical protein